MATKDTILRNKVQVIVDDNTQEIFLNDLYKKSILAANKLLKDSDSTFPQRIARAVLASYMDELGMISASGDNSSEAYAIRACVTVDVLRRVLARAGMTLEVDILPRSIAQKKYEALLLANKK